MFSLLYNDIFSCAPQCGRHSIYTIPALILISTKFVILKQMSQFLVQNLMLLKPFYVETLIRKSAPDVVRLSYWLSKFVGDVVIAMHRRSYASNFYANLSFFLLLLNHKNAHFFMKLDSYV